MISYLLAMVLRMSKELKKIYLSWEEFETTIKNYNLDTSKYDGIIAVMRGGFYIADALSRKHNVPIYYFFCHSYEGTEQKELEITNWDDIENGHYLIVDDIYATGRTVNTIKNFYTHCTFDVYCLFSNQAVHDIEYTYYASSANWIVFPWENFEEEK